MRPYDGLEARDGRALACDPDIAARRLVDTVHVGVYYPRMTEPSPTTAAPDPVLAVARDLAIAFHVGTPRHQAAALIRDLTFGQARLLFLLDREGPQPMGRVAHIFDLSSTASTGFVERVERHGLVERRHRSDDRRVVECALTDAGRRTVEELSGVRIDAMRQALSVLEPDELEAFHRLIRQVLARRVRAA